MALRDLPKIVVRLMQAIESDDDYELPRTREEAAVLIAAIDVVAARGDGELSETLRRLRYLLSSHRPPLDR